jgi:hypothetical protein
MRGLLADVNVQGHTLYLRLLLEKSGLWIFLVELQLEVVTFPDLDLAQDLDDRSLWNFCQQQGWVLLTENRNNDGPDSLQATLMDSWQPGHLPVLTLSNKRKFEHSREFASRVANDVGELLFGIVQDEYCDQSRIFVPRT